MARLLFTRARRSDAARSARPNCAIPSARLFLFRRRLALAGVLVVLALFGLFGRFFYLQVVQHDHYQTLAETNRIAIVPIVPNRGVISDRNGIVLAQSYSAYTLEIQPSRVKNLEETIDALAEIVDVQPRDRKRFRKLLDESKNFESLPLRTRLTDDEVARFAVNRYRFPGVEIKARLFRQYPYGEVASHVVGYIGRINDRDVDAHRRVGRDARTTRAPTTSARSASSSRTSASCTARPASRRSRSTPAAAPCARCRASRRRRATISRCRSTSSCRKSPKPRSATGAARWSRSIRRPATCSRSCRSPGSIPISSSTASIRRTGSC